MYLSPSKYFCIIIFERKTAKIKNTANTVLFWSAVLLFAKNTKNKDISWNKSNKIFNFLKLSFPVNLKPFIEKIFSLKFLIINHLLQTEIQLFRLKLYLCFSTRPHLKLLHRSNMFRLKIPNLPKNKVPHLLLFCNDLLIYIYPAIRYRCHYFFQS